MRISKSSKFGAWYRTLSLVAALSGATNGGAEELASGAANRLPGALVHLRDIDPTIIQDMKYSTDDNFTGHVVAGYEANECILVRAAAEALAKVQADFRFRGLTLKVYDCFRPVRAVRAFMSWAEALGKAGDVARFHPRTPKARLFALGYIAMFSSHSRGIAVDLSLVALPPSEAASFDPGAPYGPCNGPAAARAPDSSVDMGTGFDCFDPMSHTRASQISQTQQHWRELLVRGMAAHGFQNYSREWWHFTFERSGTSESFDFPIRER